MLFTLINHIHTLHPIVITYPYTCVSLLLGHDMHIAGFVLDVLPFFVITKGIRIIRIFNAIDEMCSLISTRLN